MATLVLGAVGASLGGSLGGSVLGLSGAVIGRAVGSTVGRVLDQSILGQGSEAVEHGRLDRLRLTGASEGGAIPRVFGRVRLGGQVIWATRFQENRSTSGGGGKGTPKAPEQTSFSYSISLALALCEGKILRVGRIWADGAEISSESLQIRVHKGSSDQLPDALVEAVQGVGNTPAYRGTAYVVIENLDLTPYGNRVPQFSFEVVRTAHAPGEVPGPAEQIRGVALVPGTGEYALATTSVHYDFGGGSKDSANVNTVQHASDFRVAMRDLTEELPNLSSVSLVVSWFGDDLRCGHCRIRPMVEQNEVDGTPQPWRVSSATRRDASKVPYVDGRPVYGGTPSDASVIEAIRDLNGRGIDITFYPFILMDQMAGNGRPDPWGQDEQAALPWRGRITTAIAPGLQGTTDRTITAKGEVARFFGDVSVDALSVRSDGGGVDVRSEEWSYRRFILHYAKLCAAAGGVEAFCIGSEMRSLTRIRGNGDTFPAVEFLKELAHDVRLLLPNTKIGYAADWSEYYGYHPKDTNNVHFHLDPLWGDPEIDFVGIDNYMPLADWRDGDDHADAASPSHYDIEYLQSNIEGGEGYDWYYRDATDRYEQTRTRIEDGAHGAPWVYRYKDVRNWWANEHRDRIDNVLSPRATEWRPRSKPVRFVEYGCAAIDKGANQPNKFIDAKSSESSLPYHSNGRRDDAMQMQYLRAFLDYWNDPSQNPRMDTGDRMIDLNHSFAWAWDTRPWPYFPQMTDFWTDGTNYARGHWISGRSANQPLASVIREICSSCGLGDVDTSRVHGAVRGYSITNIQTARSDLQPLLLAYGVEASERGGTIVFTMRADTRPSVIDPTLAVREDGSVLTLQRAPASETAGTVLVHHVDFDGDFTVTVGDATLPGVQTLPLSETELPLALTRGEGRSLAERFLAEAQIVRDTLDVRLPPSRNDLHAGDHFRIIGDDSLWRVDRLEERASRHIRAVRTERSIFEPSDEAEEALARTRPLAPLPVDVTVLQLPLLRGDENPYAPYLAATGRPWPDSVAVHSSIEDNDYRLNAIIEVPSVVGVTQSDLNSAIPGVWDNGPELIVRFGRANLASVTEVALFAGANAAAIGDDTSGHWEIFQFLKARLVGDGIWALSRRIRGQRGTEWAMPDSWPSGSKVVILDGSLTQVDAGPGILGLPRHYRIGPSRLPLSDPSYRHEMFAASGEALKPYSPAHLRAMSDNGGVDLEWVRRSRVAQVNWNIADVPLGETRELYLVRLLDKAGRTLLERSTGLTTMRIDAAELPSSPADRFGIRALVAQVSEEIGPGHWSSIAIP